ncbi:MAG: hypothetical protein ABIR33_09530 [Pyrinomonadaceae bacterium]
MNRDAIIRKAKGAFGKVQGLMPGYRMFLLKRESHSKVFESVAEITVPFWSKWNSFREQTRFMWADEAAEWTDLVAQSSHVGYGVPDTDSLIHAYVISYDARDRVEPNAANLFWKLYGTREPDETFEVPGDV